MSSPFISISYFFLYLFVCFHYLLSLFVILSTIYITVALLFYYVTCNRKTLKINKMNTDNPVVLSLEYALVCLV